MARPTNKDSKKLNLFREESAKKFADMIINQHMTVRAVAEANGISKSTVHNYIHNYIDSKRIKDKIDKELKSNFNNKHLRGGESTKKKFELKRKENETYSQKKTDK